MNTGETDLDRAMKFAGAEANRVGDVNLLLTPVRTVAVISTAQGMINNGGLQYLFECDFPHEPPYSIFVDAYHEIGAQDEANALAAAVKLFPFAEPHKFLERRLAFLDQYIAEGDHRSDSPFEPYTNLLCGNENVWRLLEEYVARHAAALRAYDPEEKTDDGRD